MNARMETVLKTLLGYVFAAVCMAWVLHDVQLSDLAERAVRLDWRWVSLAVGVDIASYVCQGWRWHLLLIPLGSAGIRRTTQAIYAGLFTNEILPLRAGEFVRAFLISRWMDIPVGSTIASLVIERLFDGIWLVIAIGLTIVVMPFPKYLVRATSFLAAGLLLVAAAFVFLVLRRRQNASSAGGHCPELFRRLGQNLHSIGRSGKLSSAVAVSLLFLATQATAFWLVMLAYGLHLSLWAAAVVLFIIHLGTAIPNAPANTGTFQFFCVVGLELFGIDKTTATAFSFVSFFVLTIPLWGLGFVALATSGFELGRIRSELRHAPVP
jgi:uncharacterized membrane protein YbhN (UPF0104 family)